MAEFDKVLAWTHQKTFDSVEADSSM